MKPGGAVRAGQVFAALGKSACYVVLFLGMQVLALLPPMFIAALQSAESGGDEDEMYAAMMDVDVMTVTLISGLLTLAVVLVFYVIRRKKLDEALWLRPVSAPTLFVGASFAPALYFAVILVLSMLPAAWMQGYEEASSGIDSGTVVGVIAVVFVAPVVEDFIFRGLVLNRLSRVMPGWLAVLISAAVFGACHGELVWFCYAFVLGVFFAFIDLRSGSILPSVLGHIMFNAIGQIMTFVPETETGTELVIATGALLLAAVLFPVADGIAALLLRSRRRASAIPVKRETLDAPGNYEFDPWEE